MSVSVPSVLSAVRCPEISQQWPVSIKPNSKYQEGFIDEPPKFDYPESPGEPFLDTCPGLVRTAPDRWDFFER
jgi:hypothetical protein